MWFAAVPKSSWPSDAASLAEVKRDFCDDASIGDRRQELVFIGKNIDHEGIEDELSNCLLTDFEYSLGQEEWNRFQVRYASVWMMVYPANRLTPAKDPFDDWELDESALPSSTSAHGPVDLRAEEAAQKRAFDLKLKRFM